MKIQGWFVERFGALRNHRVSDLPDGLTIFYGPNGAGKSTLLAFLRQMLLGESRRDEPTPGPGWRDENGVGRLSCAGPDGVYGLARTADRPYHLQVTRPDGGEGTQADLEPLFGGADGRVVAALLAFDVHDLRALPDVSDPGLRERIFPAGVGRNRQIIQQAFETVQARLSEHAERADTQEPPAAATDLQARIDAANSAAVRYCQILQVQAHTRADLDRHTRTIGDLKAEKSRYEALIDLWPVWQELGRARQELESIEAFETFPSDPEERLEQALAARQAAQRNVEQLDEQDRPVPVGVGETASDRSTGNVGALPSRGAGMARPAEHCPEPADGHADAAHVEPPHSDHGPEFASGEREPANPSHPSTGALVIWQRRLQEVVEAVRDRQRDLEAAKTAVRDLERTRNEISTALARPEPPSAAVLDEESRLLQHVRSTLAGLEKDRTATKRWQDLIAERSADIRALETRVTQVPSAVFAHAAWLAAAVGLAAAGWHYGERDTLGMSLTVVCSFASAVGASVQRSRRGRAIEDDSRRRSSLIGLREEVEHACQSLLQHQERVARHRFDISVDSVRLGLPPVPSEQDLLQREAELDEQQRQRREWDSARTALAETMSALIANEELERQHAQALQAAQAKGREAAEEWHQWKVRSGLADAVGVWRGTGEAELLQDCRRLRTQIAEWEQNATRSNTRARAALAGGHESVEQSPALQAARRRLLQCEGALAQLFSEAGVSDETAFRRRLAAYRRRLVLEQTIRACEIRSSERLRHEHDVAVPSDLSEGRAEECRQGATRAATELTRIDAIREEAVQRLRQLDADAATAAAQSADLASLEVERAGLVEEAAEALRQRRALEIAAALLTETQRDIERESQSATLRHASRVLAAVTFSRCERVIPSDDLTGLVVVDANGVRQSVDELSRATVQQLYFSLRLGLAEAHSQGGTRLPLLIDDVLDNFDPKRSRAMAHQVVELARKHQILVFTCRPETRDLLCSLDRTANVVTMQEL